MSIGAMEDRGDDYTSTDHNEESQDFDDLADDEAHDGGASEQDHGSPHQDSIDDEQQDEDECFSAVRIDPGVLIDHRSATVASTFRQSCPATTAKIWTIPTTPTSTSTFVQTAPSAGIPKRLRSFM